MSWRHYVAGRQRSLRAAAEEKLLIADAVRVGHWYTESSYRKWRTRNARMAGL